MSHFNALSPAEAERLAVLAEELGEAQQAVGKILRHGYASHDPTDPKHPGNRDALARELGDISGEIDRMIAACDVNESTVNKRRLLRVEKSAPYMHHQAQGGE